MKRSYLALSTAAIAVALCGSASAQSAGNFAGTALDGSNISLTVTKSGSTFTVTQVNVSMDLSCKKTGLTASEGWGFYLGSDISGGSIDFLSHNDYYYTIGSMHFSGNNTIKGTVTSYSALFVPGPTPPKASQFCVSPKQSFTLSKQPPAKVLPLQANVDTGRLKPNR